MIADGIIVAAVTAMALACARLLRGPTDADRVVALELILSSSLALIASAALAADSPRVLDVGLGLAVVAFVGTVAWARLVESSADKEAE
ncbi:MAG: monovalent cation/H+ antiporter complex subunit F [Acidobacteriota bacterium]|nr:monovalent cation/H+ antiporter complex subunit F [Acidobacteriota bacterium]